MTKRNERGVLIPLLWALANQGRPADQLRAPRYHPVPAAISHPTATAHRRKGSSRRLAWRTPVCRSRRAARGRAKRRGLLRARASRHRTASSARAVAGPSPRRTLRDIRHTRHDLTCANPEQRAVVLEPFRVRRLTQPCPIEYRRPEGRRIVRIWQRGSAAVTRKLWNSRSRPARTSRASSARSRRRTGTARRAPIPRP